MKTTITMCALLILVGCKDKDQAGDWTGKRPDLEQKVRDLEREIAKLQRDDRHAPIEASEESIRRLYRLGVANFASDEDRAWLTQEVFHPVRAVFDDRDGTDLVDGWVMDESAKNERDQRR